jgi:protein ImuB
MFACMYVSDFPVQAALRCEPEQRRELLNQCSIVILEGPPSHSCVISLNEAARSAGIALGMTKLKAESCGVLIAKQRNLQNEDAAQNALLDCARALSPRVEALFPGTVLVDLQGTEKLFGPPQQLAARIMRQSREFGFHLNIALSANADAAVCGARSWEGVSIIPQGREAQFLARLPVAVLSPLPEILDTFEAWGIRNLGALAALPEVPLVERLGQEGLCLQRLARGEESRTLVPAELNDEFIESFELDDPVETLESLSFILNRLLQQLCARLCARSLAMAELRIRFEFEVFQVQSEGEKEEFYERVWKLPLPVSDAKLLLRLTCLDLESCSFSAPVKKLIAQATPAKPRSSQGGLFAPASPQAEQLEITLARIRAIVGREDEAGIACVGSPRTIDSHQPGTFAVHKFTVEHTFADTSGEKPTIALRKFRPALQTKVELIREQPQSVLLGKKRVRVLAASGPWCSSGQWWKHPSAWGREEWDVALNTFDGTGLYRIYWDRIQQQWFIEGMFD